MEGEIIAVAIEPASREMGWTGSTASAAMTASAVSAAVAGLEMELVAIDVVVLVVFAHRGCSLPPLMSCTSTRVERPNPR